MVAPREGYASRVLKQYSTAFWINSANQDELETARRWGALGNTMNPSHPPRAITHDPQLWQPVVDKILGEDPSIDDDYAVDLVTRAMAKRSSDMFLPLYEETEGRYGYVAIQSDPNTNDVLDVLMSHAISYSQIGANVVPKIPSTKVGAVAIERLSARGVNTIATLGFSVAQAIAMAEAFERGLKARERPDSPPRCFVVVIPGIFDDYLREVAQREGITLTPQVLRYAGCSWCRVVYRTFTRRGYRADLMIGGTRQTYHITDFVGGRLHVTHNLDTWERLAHSQPPLVARIDDPFPPGAIAELEDKFVDFRRAYLPDGLQPDDFRAFGPCQKFQNNCLKGHAQTKAFVQASRARFGAFLPNAG